MTSATLSQCVTALEDYQKHIQQMLERYQRLTGEDQSPQIEESKRLTREMIEELSKGSPVNLKNSTPPTNTTSFNG